MNKIKGAIFSIVFVIFIQVFSGAESIPIFTIDQLQKIGRDPDSPMNGSYYLANDIDASETKFWNNGEGFRPIGHRDSELFKGITGWVRKQIQSKIQLFEGSFDGRGYKISDLYIIPKEGEESDFLGLFAWIGEKGYVKNINIEDIYIEDKDPYGWSFIGSVAGYNYGIVENIHSSGILKGLSYMGEL